MPETRLAEDQLNTLSANPRFTRVWNGVVWLIVRKPDIGSLLPGKQQTYVLVTTDFLAIGLPVIEVYYAIVGEINPVIEIIYIK